jgi:hypothetical protein
MKKGITRLFCCAVTAALALLAETGVRAQIGGVPLWTNFYGHGVGAIPRDLAVDTSGNVFVTGYAAGDFATVKYSGAGVPLWTNRFNGPANTTYGATAIAVDSNGNAFVTGSSFGSGCPTLKYSGAGVPLWTNYLDAFVTLGIAVDNNSGKVFVAGTTADPNTSTIGDYITVAYSNAGVPLWTNYYHGPENGNNHIRDVAVDGNGNVVVTGSAAGSFATIKYSGAGVPLWTNRYCGTAEAVVVDGGGNVFVTGSSGSICTTIKYSGAGVALWTNVFDEGGISTGQQALALDSSGNICVAASSFDSISGSNDFLTLKYSGAGVPLWTNRYNAPENLYDDARSIAVDAGGNAFVYGDSSYILSGDTWTINFTALAYSSGGVPLWINSYGERGSFGFPTALGSAIGLAVDGSGNVFVTGFSAIEHNQVYITIKYSSALRLLTINRTATNTVVLSWPSLSTGYTLQQNTDVNHAMNWSNVSAGVQDDGTTKTLIVSPASGNRFYRLHKP